jgi:L-threonylcarbamoyladenylate synthase
LKSWHLNHAARIIENGGILAYPTESVYGLGCAPFCLPAVTRILRLKRRKPDKGLILVGSDLTQFRALIDLDQVGYKSKILATWPGPVTWILPTRPGVPDWLTGKSSGLAVRISAHPLVQALCRKAGILISTSANPAGCKPARDHHQVRRYFGDEIDFIYPGTAGPALNPTEIRDGRTGNILRSAV